MAKDSPEKLVEGVPDHLCLLLHQFAVARAHERTSEWRDDLNQVVTNLISAIESRMEYESWKNKGYGDDSRLSPPSDNLIKAMITNTLTTSDPIGLQSETSDEETVNKLAKELKALLAKSQGTHLPAYHNVAFESALNLLGSGYITRAAYLYFNRPLGMQFIHQAIVRSLGYADQTPQIDCLAKIKQVIKDAFQRPTNLNLGAGDETKDQELKEKNDKERTKVTNGVAEVNIFCCCVVLYCIVLCCVVLRCVVLLLC